MLTLGETHVEPVTMIAAALAAGAAAGLKPMAEQVVKDAYEGLKTLIQQKYRKVDVAIVEADPKSESRREVVEEELAKAAADQDEELLSRARAVLETVQQHASGTARELAIDLEDLKAALSIEIENIRGGGVRGRNWETGGGIKISGVDANRESGDPKA